MRNLPIIGSFCRSIQVLQLLIIFVMLKWSRYDGINSIGRLTCRSGEIGRRARLKIWSGLLQVPVRVRPSVLRKDSFNNFLVIAAGSSEGIPFRRVRPSVL